MTMHRWTPLLAILMATAFGGAASAQEPTPAEATVTGSDRTPLTVQVVISRYQGDERISSLPYTLAVTAARVGPEATRLRMGAEVAVSGGGGPVPQIQYRHVGTSIDCSATSAGDDRFQIRVSIEDSSVYGAEQVTEGVWKVAERPVFRTFTSQNTVLLRDGQSMEFTAATDRITGEVVKVEVTLTVVK